MNKILLIDKGMSSIHDLRKSLEDKGMVLISEQDIGKTVARLKDERIDMIAIDSSLSKEALRSKDFMRLAEGIPKMVLMQKGAASASGNSIWLRDESAFPVREPVTLKELNCWIKKLTAVRQARDENRYLSAGLIARKNEFSFFEDITKIFNSASELKKDLVSIIEKVKALTAAGDWALLLNDEPMFEIIPLKFSKKIQKYVFSKNAGISSQVMEAGVPLNIPDVSHDSRFNKSSDNFSGLKIRSMLCVPLKIRNRSVGVVMLVNKKGDVPFIENDMDLAISTAGLAAMAIERAFLYQKIKYDELTNLYNATYLRESIDMEIQRAERYGSLFSIIFMDIDDFKKVNDRFGHLFG
ncbi:MAG: diguanylate cyclase, partial [Nitrospirota bacterium]|nr:diguanylate cyclase [Nitrospirota bacterium]